MFWFRLQEEGRMTRVSWVPVLAAGREQCESQNTFRNNPKTHFCIFILCVKQNYMMVLPSYKKIPLFTLGCMILWRLQVETETSTRQKAPNQRPVRSYVHMDWKILSTGGFKKNLFLSELWVIFVEKSLWVRVVFGRMSMRLSESHHLKSGFSGKVQPARLMMTLAA